MGRFRHVYLLPFLAAANWSVARTNSSCIPQIVGRVAGVVDDDELGARPRALQLPSVANGRLKVEAPVHQNSGNTGQCARPRAEGFHPRSTRRAGRSESQGGRKPAQTWDPRICGRVREPAATPATLTPTCTIRTLLARGPSGPRSCKQAVVRFDEIAAAFAFRQSGAQTLPLLGEEGRHAAAKQPVELRAPSGRDAEQDKFGDAVRVPLSVGERQRASPRSAEDQPALDIEPFTQQLDVRDQMGGGVAREVHIWVACVRRAPPAVTLIEQHDAIGARDRTACGATAVHPEPGPPWRTTAGLPPGLPHVSQYTRLPSPASSMPRLVRLDGGVQAFHVRRLRTVPVNCAQVRSGGQQHRT